MEWCAVRVDVASEVADAVTSFLLDSGAPGVVTDASDERRPAGRALLEAHFPSIDRDRVTSALARYLASLTALEPAACDATVEAAPLPPVDWEGLFRRHHRPVTIAERLVVAPPWDVPAAATGRDVLVIEPGMAFGTGSHATTRACLEEIVRVVNVRRVTRALDVGTGSGILAAALARLGVPHVVALDVDAGVLPLARENLRRNAASGVLVLAGGCDAVRARFDLVVANLLADALVSEAAGLASRVAAGGRLIASGLLDSQAGAVRDAYPGFRLAGERTDERWCTLDLVRAH
jgi:ribosomal protein L11 methyltransferase